MESPIAKSPWHRPPWRRIEATTPGVRTSTQHCRTATKSAAGPQPHQVRLSKLEGYMRVGGWQGCCRSDASAPLVAYRRLAGGNSAELAFRTSRAVRHLLPTNHVTWHPRGGALNAADVRRGVVGTSACSIPGDEKQWNFFCREVAGRRRSPVLARRERRSPVARIPQGRVDAILILDAAIRYPASAFRWQWPPVWFECAKS